MFSMIIEKQLNLTDRTLICGISEYSIIPHTILIEGIQYKVLGISYSSKPPVISLEIEHTTKNLVGNIATDAGN